MLDNAPLARLLRARTRLSRGSPRTSRRATCARSRSTRRATPPATPSRSSRRGVASRRGSGCAGAASARGSAIDHLMASTAIPVRLSGRARRRRLLHGRLGAADRAAVAGAASRRAAHPRARRRPVHRAASRRPRPAALSVVRARSPGTRCRRSSSTTSPPISSGCTQINRLVDLAAAATRGARHAPCAARRRAGAGAVARPGRAGARVRRPPAARRALPAARSRQHARAPAPT